MTELRIAIMHHDWGECIRTIQPLLENVPTKGIDIAVEQAILYLSRFSASETIGAFAGFLDALVISISDELPEKKVPNLPEETQDDILNPGFGNFIEAINHLWQALGAVNQPQKYNGLVAHAFDQLIIADICFYWASVYPDDWQMLHMFWNAEADDEGNVILPESIDHDNLARSVKFRLEPEAIGYQAAKWLMVADKLETQLKKQARLTDSRNLRN